MASYIVTHYEKDGINTLTFDSAKELLSFLRKNKVSSLPFPLEDLDDEVMEVTLEDKTSIEIEEIASSKGKGDEVVFDGKSYVSIKDYATEHDCSERKVRYAVNRGYLRFIKLETFFHKTITFVDRNGTTTRRPSAIIQS